MKIPIFLTKYLVHATFWIVADEKNSRSANLTNKKFRRVSRGSRIVPLTNWHHFALKFKLLY